MESTRHEIRVDSDIFRAARAGNSFATARVSVVKITTDKFGYQDSEWVIKSRRVEFPKLASTLETLEAKYGGCLHSGHSNVAQMISRYEEVN
jgi:hypothetical protein